MGKLGACCRQIQSCIRFTLHQKRRLTAPCPVSIEKKEGEIAILPAQLKFDVYPATQFCVDLGANDSIALGTFDEV